MKLRDRAGWYATAAQSSRRAAETRRAKREADAVATREIIADLKARGLYDHLAAICAEYGALPWEVCSRSMAQPAPEVRRVFVAWLRETRCWSSTQAGALLRRDHSTIIQNQRRHERAVARTAATAPARARSAA